MYIMAMHIRIIRGVASRSSGDLETLSRVGRRDFQQRMYTYLSGMALGVKAWKQDRSYYPLKLTSDPIET